MFTNSGSALKRQHQTPPQRGWCIFFCRSTCHLYTLTLYRGLAYTYDWRGFVGSQKEAEHEGHAVFNSSIHFPFFSDPARPPPPPPEPEFCKRLWSPGIDSKESIPGLRKRQLCHMWTESLNCILAYKPYLQLDFIGRMGFAQVVADNLTCIQVYTCQHMASHVTLNMRPQTWISKTTCSVTSRPRPICPVCFNKWKQPTKWWNPHVILPQKKGQNLSWGHIVLETKKISHSPLVPTIWDDSWGTIR
jgi:hypothetical protein